MKILIKTLKCENYTLEVAPEESVLYIFRLLRSRDGYPNCATMSLSTIRSYFMEPFLIIHAVSIPVI
jgi:hypothetical protein